MRRLLLRRRLPIPPVGRTLPKKKRRRTGTAPVASLATDATRKRTRRATKNGETSQLAMLAITQTFFFVFYWKEIAELETFTAEWRFFLVCRLHSERNGNTDKGRDHKSKEYRNRQVGGAVRFCVTSAAV